MLRLHEVKKITRLSVGFAGKEKEEKEKQRRLHVRERERREVNEEKQVTGKEVWSRKNKKKRNEKGMRGKVRRRGPLSLRCSTVTSDRNIPTNSHATLNFY